MLTGLYFRYVRQAGLVGVRQAGLPGVRQAGLAGGLKCLLFRARHLHGVV